VAAGGRADAARVQGNGLRVLIASKILLVGAYRRKLDEIAAQPDVDLIAVVPPSWREPGGRELTLEPGPTRGYQLRVEPIRFNGNFHLFHWKTLGRVLRETSPDLVHLDEEPYNLATALGTHQALRVGARSVFFTWQNLQRRYPPPFRQFERFVYRHSTSAIAGNAEAVGVLRRKGYTGPTAVIPQFGIDPDLFSPRPSGRADAPFTIGFMARLVEEKGVLVLIDALRGLDGDWRLHVIGSGPLRHKAELRLSAADLGGRVTWEAAVPSTAVPDRLRGFDALVLPSLTRSHWKEQFGRALVEAMACGVPVVGSTSGEIPHVVGDAGSVVPEGDARALCSELRRLMLDADLRADLGQRGRARALAEFTHQRVAEHTVDVYRKALEGRR
jgi:glycosyltransferase involved in cell wall biosynthesis